MKGLIKTLIALGAFTVGAGIVSAQTSASVGSIPVITGDEGAPPDWFVECTDPTNTTPVSTPYIVNAVGNELMWCAFGAGGTWTAGGTPANNAPPVPCFIPAITSNNSGEFAISYGAYQAIGIGSQNPVPQAIGSIHQYTPNFRSAGMAINYGAPYYPSYCCANFLVDNVPTFFGGTFTEFYEGQSNRYMTGIIPVGPFTVDLQVELVADALRFRWTCTNDDTAPHQLALEFGSGIEMLTDQSSKYWQQGTYAVGNFGQPYFETFNPGGGQPPTTEGFGPDQSGDPPYFIGVTNDNRLSRDEVGAAAGVSINGFQGAFVYTPNQRPPDQDTIYQLTTSNTSLFPDYIDFDFDESDPFGIRIETKPSNATNDTNPTNLPNKADFIMVGKSLYVFGPATGTQIFPLSNPFPDTGFLAEPGFVIEYDPEEVQAGTTFQFLNYVRSTWGNGDYKLPFGATVDAPSIVQAGNVNLDGTAAPSGLVNNQPPTDPMIIRVWVDNVGGNVTSGYGVNNKEFTLDNVQIKLTFGTPGITVLNGASTKVISEIAPRTDAFVDFECQVGAQTVGDVPYTVTIDTVPVNKKTITGTINVAGRPQNVLYPGANLIAAPYVFQDASWLTVLQDFVPGGANTPATGVASTASFQTYVWDPERQTYDISLTAQRAGSVWVVYNNPSTVFAPYEGTPQMPAATYSSSTFQIELKSGWNMISDPFNIVYQVNEINGVAAGDSTQVYTYDELVSLGYISGFVASYDPTSNNGQGGYDYTDGTQGFLQPNTGYWVEDLLDSDITLSFPPVYTEGTPNSYNKAPSVLAAGLWRLNLTARQALTVDPNVVVGTAASAADVRAGTIYKAPMAPTQSLSLAILGKLGKKDAFLNRALTTTSKSYLWNAQVSSTKTGEITLTWPNAASVPKSLGLFLQDMTSGITTDMRAVSSYSFAQLEPGGREFRVLVTPPIDANALIASLSGALLTVDKRQYEKITYSLRAHATTTLKVFGSSGELVCVLHSPQVDGLGETSSVWDLKSSTGATVRAGRYTLVLSALTDTGEEQSKSAVIDIE